MSKSVDLTYAGAGGAASNKVLTRRQFTERVDTLNTTIVEKCETVLRQAEVIEGVILDKTTSLTELEKYLRDFKFLFRSADSTCNKLKAMEGDATNETKLKIDETDHRYKGVLEQLDSSITELRGEKSIPRSLHKSNKPSSHSSKKSKKSAKMIEADAQLAIEEINQEYTLTTADLQAQKAALEAQLLKAAANKRAALAKANRDAILRQDESDEESHASVVTDKGDLLNNFLVEQVKSIKPKVVSKHVTIPAATKPNVPVPKVQPTEQWVDHSYLNLVPVAEPPVFSGDPSTYLHWRTAFTSLIERRPISPDTKLHLLQRYLSGKALACVRGLFLLDPSIAYEKAKKILDDRYGNPTMLANSFRQSLDEWPKMEGNNSEKLREFSDLLVQCSIAMIVVPGMEILNDKYEIRKLVAKLPQWLLTRWNRKASQYKSENEFYPPFEVFSEFLKYESDLACDPDFSLQSFKSKPVAKPPPRYQSRSFATNSNNTPPKATAKDRTFDKPRRPPSCFYCKKEHFVSECRDFCKIPKDEQLKLVSDFSLCKRCFRHTKLHLHKECRFTVICTICKKNNHLAANHIFSNGSLNAKAPAYNPANVTSVTSHAGHLCGNRVQDKSTMIVPVWVSHEDNPNEEVLVYALLDNQSDASFVSSKVATSLHVEGVTVRLALSTMTSDHEFIESKKLSGLSVRGYYSQEKVQLPPVFSRDSIPANRDHIPTPAVANRVPYLRCISSKLIPLQDCDFGLLIGYNCQKALNPRSVIPAVGDGPFAQESVLGWGIVGVLDSVDDVVSSYNIKTDSVPQVVLKTCTKEMFSCSQVLNILESDFKHDVAESDQKVSQEDTKFLRTIEEGIHKSGKHYEMPLPFKANKEQLFSNKEGVLKRMAPLKTKLEQNPQYAQEYNGFMNEMIDNSYAEEVVESVEPNDVWYIPHFGIYGKRKKKLRVVFDCSAKYRGRSLNDTLLQGPDLVNALIGVLCRFRVGSVAFMADVEKMFYQFKVNKEHRDFLRFLWWPGGDTSKPLKVYRMCVHIFGAISSPSCATYGLRQIAKDNSAEYGEDVQEYIGRDFYVDDGLKSTDGVEYAKDLINRSVSCLKEGGVRLCKFVSNELEVLADLKDEDKAKQLQSVNLEFDDECAPVERVLGTEWNIILDSFQFRVTLEEHKLTRRGILSTASSIYDPLGFLCPFVLKAKLILQELCKLNYGWDDSVPAALKASWMDWCLEVPTLSELKIKRCYKPSDFGQIDKVELHHFSDASSIGYGQCSYLKLVDCEGKVHVSFVMGKARVAPLKVLSIPKLELMGAVVSVRVARVLEKELPYTNIKHVFWTDSENVLRYISNESRRFHVYVAHRVQEIRNSTEPAQWFHVPGLYNPADVASRGLTATELVQNKVWFNGPNFLWEATLPFDSSYEVELNDSDPEVKRVKCLATSCKVSFDCERFSRCSSWSRLVKVVALCIQWARKVKNKLNGSIVDSIATEQLEHAKLVIIRCVQRQHFGEEEKVLQSLTNDRAENRKIRKKSSLKNLDCYLDTDNVIRVGGRLRHSSLPTNELHPVVLPKQIHVSRLIIGHYHEQCKHQGRVMTQGLIRSAGFWIINAHSEIYQFIGKCVTCKRFRGSLGKQKMADLPSDRVSECSPFDYTGVDYFGPFIVKEGRKELKRYGVMFTCLSSRAVHLEIANSLSTDSFINALRRFMSVRGPIRVLRSDQGTNFIGAMGQLDHKKIESVLLAKGCDFEFKLNPPSSSNFGGVWERLIRSTRNILDVMLKQLGDQLDDECLRTLMSEVMSILNNRPLTTSSLYDVSASEPLTPNHILTMKTKVMVAPPGEFMKHDVYSVKRWRRVQYMVNEFWSRWRKEYVQFLQPRSKWQGAKPNVKVNDVVVICDDNAPRNMWKLAKVVEATPSVDGLVRKVKLTIGDKYLNSLGQRVKKVSFLERPVNKLVVLVSDN